MIGHVKPSKKDTCETQVQIAAQSSRIDTVRLGQETVYKADCQWETSTKAAPKPAPETAKKPAEAKPQTKAKT